MQMQTHCKRIRVDKSEPKHVEKKGVISKEQIESEKRIRDGSGE